MLEQLRAWIAESGLRAIGSLSAEERSRSALVNRVAKMLEIQARSGEATYFFRHFSCKHSRWRSAAVP